MQGTRPGCSGIKKGLVTRAKAVSLLKRSQQVSTANCFCGLVKVLSQPPIQTFDPRRAVSRETPADHPRAVGKFILGDQANFLGNSSQYHRPVTSVTYLRDVSSRVEHARLLRALNTKIGLPKTGRIVRRRVCRRNRGWSRYDTEYATRRLHDRGLEPDANHGGYEAQTRVRRPGSDGARRPPKGRHRLQDRLDEQGRQALLFRLRWRQGRILEGRRDKHREGDRYGRGRRCSKRCRGHGAVLVRRCRGLRPGLR